MTALSTGFFQVEDQRITLLATRARSFMLVTTRETTYRKSTLLSLRITVPQLHAGVCGMC